MTAGRPGFMTPAMWFVWLLRSDIRAGASIDDASAQRDFVAWWLLWGPVEYPAAWSCGTDQFDVAMAPVPVPGGLALPRLLRRLHASRADLRQNYPITTAEEVAEYLCWYRLFGPADLACAPVLRPAELAVTEAPTTRAAWAAGAAVPRMAIAMVRSSPALRTGRNYRDVATRAQLGAWFRASGAGLIPLPAAPTPLAAPTLPAGPDEINLVGFARAEFGLGEDVRMLSDALRAVGCRHRVIDVPAGAAIRHQDTTLDAPLGAAPAPGVSVYCMSPFDTAMLYLARGPGFFAGQYRIGYWPWELPRFPAAWGDAVGLVDEIWTPSRFAADAVAGCGKPVHVVPPSVTVPAALVAARRGHRAEESVPYRFVYPFDPNSFLARKNPLALVLAFRAAFAAADGSVGLVLRVNGDPAGHDGWQPVAAAAAADPRILILSGTLGRREALGVVAACDCLVSPHRSEGFGRNIAEALLLGLDVLATGFSGCLDFLAPAECIAWEPQPVAPGAYPFGDGQWWAEPEHDDLVASLRRIRAHPSSPLKRKQRAQAIAATHGAAQVGAAAQSRLKSLLK